MDSISDSAAREVELQIAAAFNQLKIVAAFKQLSGWWLSLLCLPVAFVTQIAMLTCFCRECEPMQQGAMALDVLIFIRSVAGLIWQRQSQDWRVYCVFQFALIPLIPFIGFFVGLGEIFSH